jgi:hypothetical protein
MRRFMIALLGAPVGYLAFAFAGYWMIELFSDNAFDRSLEASMTAVFVIGSGRRDHRIYCGIGSGWRGTGNPEVTGD